MGAIVEFRTIAELFERVCEHFRGKNQVAFSRKVKKSYRDIRHDDLHNDVEFLVNSLDELGLKKGDRVGIMSENRLEWIVASFACSCSGITDVPIFPTLTPDEAAYIFANAGVTSIFCSNTLQLKKLAAVADQIPTLTSIILFDSSIPQDVRSQLPVSLPLPEYEDLLKRGKKRVKKSPGLYEAKIAEVGPDDLLTIIYTSGTTGTPKGVMLSHGNLSSNIVAALDFFPIGPDDVVLSYLPLCHAFERMAGFYSCFAAGSSIAFAENIDTLVTNFTEVRPTFMTTVPRFLERLRGRIEGGREKLSERDRKIFDWGLRVARKAYHEQRLSGKEPGGLRYYLADRLVLRKIRERTGGRLRIFVSGGAPLAIDTGEFIFSLGIRVVEGYGLTESSPVIAVNPADAPRLGTVGLPLKNIEVKIAEDGEIMTRGPHVMQGYYNDPVATGEAIEPDGWLHTGDIGEFDEKGYLKITDRKKNLFISSGGKNIAPAPIEELILGSPFVEQVLLLGDDLPYVAALIVPNFPNLASELGRMGVDRLGGLVSDDARQQVATLPEANAIIEADLRARLAELASYERVRKFALLSEEFTPENGLLTPTLKVRRKEVMKRYASEIDQLYEGVERKKR